MPDYYGLKAICERLQISFNTFYSHVNKGILLAYRRNKPGKNRKLDKATWYTNEELILLSEISRCKKAREERLEKQGVGKISKERATDSNGKDKHPSSGQDQQTDTPQHLVSGGDQDKKG